MSTYQDLEIDKNYKIPKRKFDETMNGAQFGVSPNLQDVMLNNSYYNNFHQSPGFLLPWQQAPMYNQYPMPNTVEPITQNICNTLSHIKEQPKNQRKDIFKETVPDVTDLSLPKELTSMFQPLFCKLCMAQLSSNVMAKLHYKSRNHEKKIKKFLIEYSERTGEPLHKRAKATAAAKVEEDAKPEWFHCKVCDLKLTGKMHAESHYMGKHHLKASLGHKLPTGQGFYNDEGNWVRQSTKKKVIMADGEDNFGMAFRTVEVPKPSSSATSVVPSKFYCSICSVNATCQEQIEMHYKGQKHLKKLKQLDPMLKIRISKPGATVDVSKIPTDNVNLSVYRTPSGDFYCSNCNLTLNSEPQFKLHLCSKGHMKKTQRQQYN